MPPTTLAIRLTEPVVFLRSDRQNYRRNRQNARRLAQRNAGSEDIGRRNNRNDPDIWFSVYGGNTRMTGNGIGHGMSGGRGGEIIMQSTSGRGTGAIGTRNRSRSGSRQRTPNGSDSRNRMPVDEALELDDDRGRLSREDEEDADAPPALLRGILTLTLNKSSRVKKVGVRLVGKSHTDWPEGIGTHRLDVLEEQIILDENYVLFSAAESRSSIRRAVSIGPGVQDNPQATLNGKARASSQVGIRRISLDISPRLSSTVSVDSSSIMRSAGKRKSSWINPFVGGTKNLRTSIEVPPTPTYVDATPAVDSPVSMFAGRNNSPSQVIHRGSDFSHSSGSCSTLSTTRDSNLSRDAIQSDSLQIASGSNGSLDRVRLNPNEAATLQPHYSRMTTSASNSIVQRPPTESMNGSIRIIHDKPKAQKKFSFSKLFGNDKEKLQSMMGRSSSPDRQSKLESKDSASTTTNRGRTRTLRAFKEALISKDTHAIEDGPEGKIVDKDENDDNTWTEFRPGTYTYPIQIPVSATLPPTLHCNFGAVTYHLKAYVQRAGVLTSNLQNELEVHFVSCPTDDSTEAVESIVIERFWETQMRYMVALSGKSFCVGAKIPVSIRLDPLAKIKVYRILVVLEEKVDYFANSRKVSRHEGPKRFQLLKAEIPGEGRNPILPIMSEEEDAFDNSPLRSLFVHGEGDESHVPQLADPLGPWMLEGELQLPDCMSNVHFSMVHDHALLAISHLLRIVIRVERGDDEHVDSKGQRKLWDVIIESPLHILSCRCSHNHLPTYLPDGRLDLGDPHQCGFHHHELSDLERPTLPPTSPISPTSPTTPTNSRTVERQLQHSLHFARLVSGEINAVGARPPAYAEVVTDND